MKTSSLVKVTKAEKSKIDQVDFDNLVFGKTFTDHMFVCDFKDGQWQTPEILPYQPLTLDPSAKVFHYGQAVFEGMKAYKDTDGKVWLFRPEENYERINKSSARLQMPEFPRDFFFEGLEQLLNLDKEWIKSGQADGNALYIRPFVIASQPGVMASPSTEYKFIIICSPVQAYYTKDVKVKIADYYSRAANGGFGAAKAAGNYAGQFYPTRLVQEEGFDQVIWTDDTTHEYLEEAGTMNIFFRINDTLVTCPTSDRILDGVTRKSVIAMAEKLGITVEVRKVTVKEITEAAANGTLKESFGSGTAAVISPIGTIAYKDQVWDLEKPENCYSATIKKAILDVQYNAAEDTFGWRHEVK
ncbi:branched-chain amino acid aminotransferase [Neptunitalea lumnitzerae]|uniref:Branched-chain-amino-acid aminotransferase n=1 Tax=Neptunitalea lumnitzerae TaxID=2965509 RepID=A0ABQ5MMS0_9FLAO|nr:branched-chain amino acid aminotransferase [Neptunitalea sp. Y10]GLB50606.1 branched-chain-amino-acid aminotransferase [Neptunitalea sp. Y10]